MPLDQNEVNGEHAPENDPQPFKITIDDVVNEVENSGYKGFFGQNEEAGREDIKNLLLNRKSVVFYNAAGENISDYIDEHPEDFSMVSYIARTTVTSENEKTFEPTLVTEILQLRNEEGALVINRSNLNELGKGGENREAEQKMAEDIRKNNAETIPSYKELRENTRKIKDFLGKDYQGQSVQEAWEQRNDREIKFFQREAGNIGRAQNAQELLQAKNKKRIGLKHFPSLDGISRATYMMYDASGTPEAEKKNLQITLDWLKPETNIAFLNNTISDFMKNPAEMLLTRNPRELMRTYKKYYHVASKMFLNTTSDFGKFQTDPEIKAFLRDRESMHQTFGLIEVMIKLAGSKYYGLMPDNLGMVNLVKFQLPKNLVSIVPKGEGTDQLHDYFVNELAHEGLKQSDNQSQLDNNAIIRSKLNDGEEFDIELQGENVNQLNLDKRKEKAAEYFKAQEQGTELPRGITGVKIVHNPESLRKLQEKSKNGASILGAKNLLRLLQAGITDDTYNVLPDNEIKDMRTDYLTGRAKPITDAQKLERLLAGMENLDQITLRKGTKKNVWEVNMRKAFSNLMTQMEKNSQDRSDLKMKNILDAMEQTYLAAKEYCLIFAHSKKDRREAAVYDAAKQIAELTASMSKSYRKALQYNLNYEPEMPKTNIEIYAEAMMESLAQSKDKNFEIFARNMEKWNQADEEFKAKNIESLNGTPEQAPGISDDVKKAKAQLDERTEKLARSSLLVNTISNMNLDAYHTLIENLKKKPHSEDTKRKMDSLTSSFMEEYGRRLALKKAGADYDTVENTELRDQLKKGMSDLDQTGTTWRDHKQFKELKQAEWDLVYVRQAIKNNTPVNPGVFFRHISPDSGVNLEVFTQVRDALMEEDHKTYNALYDETLQLDIEIRYANQDENQKNRAQCEKEALEKRDTKWAEWCENHRADFTIAAFERLETKLLTRVAQKAGAYAEYVGEFKLGKNERQQNRAMAAREIRDAAIQLAVDNEKIQKTGTPLMRGSHYQKLRAEIQRKTVQKQKIVESKKNKPVFEKQNEQIQ